MKTYLQKTGIFLFISLVMVACGNKNQSQSQGESEEASVKKLELTCYNSQTEEHIEKECSEDDAISYFSALPQAEDTFLMVVVNEAQAIQFMWVEEGKCLVEITNDSEDMVFMQRYATPEEALEILKTAYIGDVNNLKGFAPVPVMEKTLNEVLGIEEE